MFIGIQNYTFTYFSLLRSIFIVRGYPLLSLVFGREFGYSLVALSVCQSCGDFVGSFR